MKKKTSSRSSWTSDDVFSSNAWHFMFNH